MFKSDVGGSGVRLSRESCERSRMPKGPTSGDGIRIGKVSAENKAVKRSFPRFFGPVDQGENWFKLRQELIGLAFHDPHWGSSPRRRNFNKDQRSARAFQPQFPSRATIIHSK